jgi:hypothetical protein
MRCASRWLDTDMGSGVDHLRRRWTQGLNITYEKTYKLLILLEARSAFQLRPLGRARSQLSVEQRRSYPYCYPSPGFESAAALGIVC